VSRTADPSKLRPRAAQLLRAFRDAPHQTLTTHEVADVAGYGYSSRISEIRAYFRYLGTGERITSKPIHGRAGAYRFTLTGPAAGVGAAQTPRDVDDKRVIRDRGVDSGGPPEDRDRDQEEEEPPSSFPAKPEHDQPPAPSGPAARLFDAKPEHDREAA
jgi:hypothetical protein